MHRYIIEDKHFVSPFNEPASLLSIGLQPLKLHQEELFSAYLGQAVTLAGIFAEKDEIVRVEGEAVVYRDNLWFDREFLDYFMERARKSGHACRAAFPVHDPAFGMYTLPLAQNFQKTRDWEGNEIYLLDLWYFPQGYTDSIMPVVVPSDAHEMGFYSVPDYMTQQKGNLTHYAPMRAVISVESWVHVYYANIIFGTYARSGRLDKKIENSFFAQVRMLWRAVVEQKQLLTASGAVKIGKNCSIDPTAIIRGPTQIGDNCHIGSGVIIDNCTIGDNVSIDSGCMMFQSVVGNNSFLPFRASLYLTATMENVIVAQNTCLQMCVIGRNTFVGAGNTFTDFNLVAQKPIKATTRDDRLEAVGQVVLGSAIGHNCRIGSGMVVFPGRMIESDTVLVASPHRRVISRSVTYEESDHHFVRGGEVHRRFYPRPDEVEESEAWEDAW